MLVINRLKALKVIILFALINSSIFLAFIPQGFSVLRMSIVLVLLISVLLLFYFSLNGEIKNYYIHPYFKLFLFLLLIWSSFVIFRSLSINTTSLISLFGHYQMGWAWITPLAFVFGLNILNWLNILNFLGKILLVGIVLLSIVPISGDEELAIGIVEWLQIFPFVLFMYMYQNRFYKNVTLISVISFVIASVYNDQRISVLLIGLILIFVIIEYMRNSGVSGIKKTFLMLLSFVIILFLYLQMNAIYTDVSKDKHATANTREFLFVELFNDLSEKEKIIGRGALGTYYSPYFSLQKRLGNLGDSPTRSGTEVGYLEMILKGGYILMILNILILLPAAYLGIFRSNNMIARMSGYIIVMYLLIWTISYYSVYSAEYLLLWMAVGTAISPNARKFTDKQALKYIEGKHK